MKNPRLGIALRGVIGVGATMEAAKLAERRGYDGAWLVEVVDVDTFSLAAAVASHTYRLKVGVGVVNPYSRVPALIAMSAATVDQISKGRFLLGIGSSDVLRVEGPFGVEFGNPVARVRESIEITKRALSGGEVDYSGEAFKVKNLKLGLLPYGRRSGRATIPIYVAAFGPRMLQMAGEVADGVILMQCPPRYVQRSLDYLRKGLAKSGRSESQIDVACYILSCISKRRKEARRLASVAIASIAPIPVFGQHYARIGFQDEVARIQHAWSRGNPAEAYRLVTDRMAEELILFGTPDECKARLKEFVSAGVKWPIIYPFANESRHARNVMYTINEMGE